MQLSVVLLCACCLVLSDGAPPPSAVKQDFADLIALIPVNKLLPVVVNYLAYDDDVKELVAYMRTDEFKEIVNKMAALPEYKNLLDFLESLGLEAYKYVNVIHTLLGVPGFEVKDTPVLTGGVKGLLTDVLAHVPFQQFNDVINSKLENNPQLQAVMDKFQGEEFTAILNKLTNLREFQALLTRFQLDPKEFETDRS